MRRGDSLNVSRGNKTPSRWEGLGRSEPNLLDEERVRGRTRPGQSPGPVRPKVNLTGEAVEQDAAILASVRNDDMKIRNGTALLKPSEIRNRTPGKKPKVDWGECPLTFDAIKNPVRAGDGHVYERWAIEKWLLENDNRSPLTNVKIDPNLVALTDADQGTARGARHVSPERQSIKTEINTILNTVRDKVEIDEGKYTAPRASTGPSAAEGPARQPAAGGSSVGHSTVGTGTRNSVATDESERETKAGQPEDEQTAKNRQIAAIMRDMTIPAADKQRKIQEIRSGKKEEEPEPMRPEPGAASRVSNHSSFEPSEQVAEVEDEQAAKNRKIAAIMRDTSIPAADKQRRIQEIRSGKKTEEPEVQHGRGSVQSGGAPDLQDLAENSAERPRRITGNLSTPQVPSPKPSPKPSQNTFGDNERPGHDVPEKHHSLEPSPAAKAKTRVEEEKEEEEKRLQALKKRGFKGYDPTAVNSFGSDWKPPDTIASDNVDEVVNAGSPNKLDPSKLVIGGRDQGRGSQEFRKSEEEPKEQKAKFQTPQPSPKPTPAPLASAHSPEAVTSNVSGSLAKAADVRPAASKRDSLPTQAPSRPSFPGMSEEEMKALEQESMALVQQHFHEQDMSMPFKDQASMDAALTEATALAAKSQDLKDRKNMESGVAAPKPLNAGAVAAQMSITENKALPPGRHVIPELNDSARHQAAEQAAAGRKGMFEWFSGGGKTEQDRARLQRSQTLPNAQADEVGNSEMVGVGITFGQYAAEHAHGGGLYVKMLQEGGPAHSTQQVLLGDMLFEVDGVNVYKRSVNRIQSRILGPPNSVVDLVFKRSAKTRRSQHELASSCSEPLEKLTSVYVTLTRKPPQPGHKLGLVADSQQPAGAVERMNVSKEATPQQEVRGSPGRGQPKQSVENGPASKVDLVIPFGIDDASRPRPDSTKLPSGLRKTLDVQSKTPPATIFGEQSSTFVEMFNEGEFLDLIIQGSDGHCVKGHRVFVSACSAFIRQVLRKGSGQINPTTSVQSTSSESRVLLADCPGWALQCAVEFLYKGNHQVSGALEMFEVYRVAKLLQVESLQEATEESLLSMLKTDTCCELMMLAQGQGVLRVADTCRQHLLKYFVAASRTNGFLSLAESDVEGLLRSESLQARKEEEIFDSLLTWMLNDNAEAVASGKMRLRGERLARHIRFATMSMAYLQKLQSNSVVIKNPKLKAYVDQGVAVQSSGASAQPRPLVGVSSSSSGAQGQAKDSRSKPQRARFTFDSSKSHMNHSVREAGMKSVLREDGDSEQSALLSPAIPRNGKHYVEFLLENTGTPDCYIQIGVCTGSHDVAGGTPAYQSDSGWCFSCHNGNLLHYDQGAEYSKKLPRQGDRVGLLVDMDARTLEVFVNSEGQGVMVRNLPDTLFFVVDAGDKGQALRIMPPSK